MRLAVAITASLLVVHARTAQADDKSPALALGLSVGSTVGGFVLVGAIAGDSEAPRELLLPGVLAVVTGPSWGHVYTGDYDLAIGGTVLRLVGAAMVGEGRGKCVDNNSDDIDHPCSYENKTPGLIAAGTILIVGTALAEMIDSPYAAKRYNREHAVTLTPTTTTNGGYGLALSGSF